MAVNRPNAAEYAIERSKLLVLGSAIKPLRRTAGGDKVKTRTIRQTVTFKAGPHDVYEILMDSRKHTKFTESKCTISRKVGGKFSISDGYIIGENIELIQDKKIVQLWKPEEDCWPTDHYSRVTFSIKAVKNGTRLIFTQSGVPTGCGDRFDAGWREYYWSPMRDALEPGEDGT
jgi:activator of HSP90 ATPase